MTDEFYVVLRLTTGEQVMAVLKEEDDKYILLDNPMCIRMIPVMNANREHVVAHPLCHFTDDDTYAISKRNVLFVKKMHHMFIPHYLRIVEQHHQEDFFQPRDEKRAEDLVWEDDFTPETAKKAVEVLKDIFGEEKREEKIDWKEKLKNLVPGNDTIN
jgi:hypothetical protein